MRGRIFYFWLMRIYGELMRRTYILKNRRAFTLAELLVTALVFLASFVGVLFLFTNAMSSTEYAGDLTTATSHGEHILEEMKTRATLTDITSEDWQDWALNDNLLTLPQETVQVSYVDTNADPLDIEVEIGWTRKSRNYEINLRTQMTK